MAWFEHNTSRIYYEETGRGDPLLVLPGFAGSIVELSVLREALTAAGYRVIAADLPGSGRSAPQPRTYTANYLADDARAFAAFLDHLATGPARLIGFSDGGEVALLMAELTPALVRSVATWGSAGQVNDPDGHLRDAMYSVVDDPIPPMRGFSDDLIAAYGRDNARAMTRSFVDAVSAIIDRGGDISLSNAGSIDCPVLLIAGEHDFLAPPGLVAELAARIPAARMLVASDAGHDLHVTRPDWLERTLLDWVGKGASPTQPNHSSG